MTRVGVTPLTGFSPATVAHTHHRSAGEAHQVGRRPGAPSGPKISCDGMQSSSTL